MNNRGHRFGGNWTDQKLECVREYLHAYTTIMNSQQFLMLLLARDTVNDENADQINSAKTASCTNPSRLCA